MTMSDSKETNSDSLFCLLCNSALDPLYQPTDSGGQGLVLVNTEGEGKSSNIKSTTDSKKTNTEETVEKGKLKPNLTSESKWIDKFQTFLSKTLGINFEDILDDELEPGASKRLKPDGKEEEIAMFCSNCKNKVEDFYNINEKLQLTTKEFEETKDKIASTMVRTFVEQKLKPEDEGDTENDEGDTEELINSTAESLLQKWKHVYSGEADRELKERNLVEEIRDEISAKSETRFKTEFPEGTGLSAMELAKMQRMMTACYFTPKMSIVRKKGKLFFRVGIPRQNDKTYKCPNCEATFQHQRSLNIHMIKHRAHRTSTQHSVPRCHICEEIFKERRDLVFHKINSHNGTPECPRAKYKRFQEVYPCDFCSCRFSSKNSKNIHQKKSHPRVELQDTTITVVKNGGLKK